MESQLTVRVVRTVAVALLAATVANGARAESPNVRYAAPAACPTVGAFSSEFSRLTRKSPRTDQAFAFDVAIVEEQGSFRGTLEVSVPNQVHPKREIRDESCADVVLALAFIAAVHVDPDLATGSAPAGASASFESDPPDAEKLSPEPPTPPDQPKAARVVRAAPSKAPPPEERSGKANERFQAGVLASFKLETALEPGVALSPWFGMTARYAAMREWRIEGSLSGTVGNSGTLSGSAGDAELSWILVRATGCFTFRRFAPFGFAPCAFVDVGTLDAEGFRIEHRGTRGTLWLAPGALGRASVDLGRVVSLSAEGGIFVPLNRPVFYFSTEGGGTERVHEVPAVGISAAASLSVYVF